MKLYIKQDVLTLGERFAVKDEFGNDAFYVEGSFLRIPKQFKVYDQNQVEVATIDRQMFRLLSHPPLISKRQLIHVYNKTRN